VEESGCTFAFTLISFITYLFLFFFEGEARFRSGGPYSLVWELVLIC
jgi:hypothetical protein